MKQKLFNNRRKIFGVTKSCKPYFEFVIPMWPFNAHTHTHQIFPFWTVDSLKVCITSNTAQKSRWNHTHILGRNLLLSFQDHQVIFRSTDKIYVSVSNIALVYPSFLGRSIRLSMAKLDIVSSLLLVAMVNVVWNAELPTPWTAAASAANLPHNAPTPLTGLSNQPISCFNIAANAATLSKLILM